MMILEEVQVNWFAWILLIVKVKFGNPYFSTTVTQTRSGTQTLLIYFIPLVSFYKL